MRIFVDRQEHITADMKLCEKILMPVITTLVALRAVAIRLLYLP